jgi:hypothetical protein
LKLDTLHFTSFQLTNFSDEIQSLQSVTLFRILTVKNPATFVFFAMRV